MRTFWALFALIVTTAFDLIMVLAVVDDWGVSYVVASGFFALFWQKEFYRNADRL